MTASNGIEVRAQTIVQVILVALVIWFGTTTIATHDDVIGLKIEVRALKEQAAIQAAATMQAMATAQAAALSAAAAAQSRSIKP